MRLPLWLLFEETLFTSLVESHSLRGALPCLTTSDGIESLTWKVGTSNPAVFYVGVEDTGRIYEITSDGNSNGDVCFDGGMGRDGISSLVHDGTYLWSVFGEDSKLAVVDPDRGGCSLAVIHIPTQYWDTEGLVIDFENNLISVQLMSKRWTWSEYCGGVWLCLQPRQKGMYERYAKKKMFWL